MRKNTKYIVFSFVSLGCIVLLTMVIFLRNTIAIPYNDLCRGGLYYDYLSEDNAYAYKVDHSIYFSEQGGGYDTLRGGLDLNGKSYFINRTVNFNYKKMSSGRIMLKISSVNRTPQDTLPEVLSRQYLSFYEVGAVTYVRADSLDSHRVVVGGSMGEIFVCSYK